MVSSASIAPDACWMKFCRASVSIGVHKEPEEGRTHLHNEDKAIALRRDPYPLENAHFLFDLSDTRDERVDRGHDRGERHCVGDEMS